MSLSRTFSMLSRAPRLMDPWDNFFGTAMTPFQTNFTPTWPAVDMVEKSDAWEMHVDIPGCKKEDISLSIQDKRVEISGKREHETRQGDASKNLRRVERSFGSFQRSFILPESIDETKIEASITDGVLEVKLPKKTEASSPRSIPITLKSNE